MSDVQLTKNARDQIDAAQNNGRYYVMATSLIAALWLLACIAFLVGWVGFASIPTAMANTPLLIQFAVALFVVTPAMCLVLSGLSLRFAARQSAVSALHLKAIDILLAPASAQEKEIRNLADAINTSAQQITAGLEGAARSTSDYNQKISSDLYAVNKAVHELSSDSEAVRQSISSERKALDETTQRMNDRVDLINLSLPDLTEKMSSAAEEAHQKVSRLEKQLETKIDAMNDLAERVNEQTKALDKSSEKANERGEALYALLKKLEDEMDMSRKSIDTSAQASEIAATAAENNAKALTDAIDKALVSAHEATEKIRSEAKKAIEDCDAALSRMGAAKTNSQSTAIGDIQTTAAHSSNAESKTPIEDAPEAQGNALYPKQNKNLKTRPVEMIVPFGKITEISDGDQAQTSSLAKATNGKGDKFAEAADENSADALEASLFEDDANASSGASTNNGTAPIKAGKGKNEQLAEEPRRAPVRRSGVEIMGGMISFDSPTTPSDKPASNTVSAPANAAPPTTSKEDLAEADATRIEGGIKPSGSTGSTTAAAPASETLPSFKLDLEEQRLSWRDLLAGLDASSDGEANGSEIDSLLDKIEEAGLKIRGKLDEAKIYEFAIGGKKTETTRRNKVSSYAQQSVERARALFRDRPDIMEQAKDFLALEEAQMLSAIEASGRKRRAPDERLTAYLMLDAALR